MSETPSGVSSKLAECRESASQASYWRARAPLFGAVILGLAALWSVVHLTGRTHAVVPSSPPRERLSLRSTPLPPGAETSDGCRALMPLSVKELDEWVPVSARSVRRPPVHWLSGLSSITVRKKSQSSQDGILYHIFKHIGVTNKYFVEFGFNSPVYEESFGYGNTGTGSNTYYLYLHGFSGLLIDCQNENKTINLVKSSLYASNVASVFGNNSVPLEFDYLSVDMDSHDLWVLRAILLGGYRPRVVSTEYNLNWEIGDAFALSDPTMDDDATLKPQTGDVSCVWGASYKALKILAEQFDYSIVARSSFLDLFWVRNDILRTFNSLVPQWEVEKLPMPRSVGPNQRFRYVHHRAYYKEMRRLVDYETYAVTGNLTLAKERAIEILFAKYSDFPCVKDALACRKCLSEPDGPGCAACFHSKKRKT